LSLSLSEEGFPTSDLSEFHISSMCTEFRLVILIRWKPLFSIKFDDFPYFETMEIDERDGDNDEDASGGHVGDMEGGDVHVWENVEHNEGEEGHDRNPTPHRTSSLRIFHRAFLQTVKKH